MATSGPYVLDRAFKTAADYSGNQYCAMTVTALDTVTISGATDRVIGVLQDAPVSGHFGTVRMLGLTKAVSDGTTPIGVGDYVGPGSSGGKMVKKATADYNVAGIALSASSADGVVIEVFLTPGAWFRSVAG